MLRKKAVTDKDTRFKYACLAILGGVLFPTFHRPKISKEHVELIRDIDEFFSFPWGRLAFVEHQGKDEVVLAQSTLAVKGFFHVVQLVMVEAVPTLLEVVQVNEILSSECDSEGEGCEPLDVEPLGLDMEGQTYETKLSLSPLHSGEVDEECKAIVDSIIADNGDTNVDGIDLGWSDDEEDENVDNLVKLVGEEFDFQKHMFKGGLTLVELIRMREEKKEIEKNAKKEKKSVEKNSNIDASVIAGLVVSKIGECLLAFEGKISQVYEKVKDIEESVNCLENKLTASIDRKFSEFETTFVSRILTSLEKNVDVGKNASPTVSLDATNVAPMVNRSGGSPLGAEVDKAMRTYAEATGVINCVLGALNNLHVPEGNLDGGKSNNPHGSSSVSQDLEQLNDRTSSEETLLEGGDDCGGDHDLGHDFNKGETKNLLVENDGNEIRKSKRQRVVPPVLKDFQLDRRTFGFDSKADHVAKFLDLQERLKSPCIISLGNGSSMNNKDILEIAERTKIMGAKSMDALMHYISVAYHKQSHCTVDKKIQFFDTKFTSLLMKHFTKFSRIASKDKEKFVFQENLMEYFVTAMVPLRNSTSPSILTNNIGEAYVLTSTRKLFLFLIATCLSELTA